MLMKTRKDGTGGGHEDRNKFYIETAEKVGMSPQERSSIR
jgi:hypothetical protein